MTTGAQWKRVRTTAKAAAFLGTLALQLLFIPPRASAQDPHGLDQVLSKTHAFVEEFIQQFAYLRYKEEILQEKLNKNKVQYKQETVYDSLVIVRFEDGQIRVAEQRLAEKVPKRPEPRPLLQTGGFSALAMIFHPFYDSSFRFTRLDDVTSEGKLLARIHFEHIHGTPSPALCSIILTDKPLELTGTAWIDPATGEIHRIETEIGSTLADLGMKTLHAELFYGSVPLMEQSHQFWLPVSATIDLETPHQHWRNVHRFRDYRQYRVDVKIEPVSQKP